LQTDNSKDKIFFKEHRRKIKTEDKKLKQQREFKDKHLGRQINKYKNNMIQTCFETE
jgi:hypothetical protein